MGVGWLLIGWVLNGCVDRCVGWVNALTGCVEKCGCRCVLIGVGWVLTGAGWVGVVIGVA